jgi:SAM-dependent methyltransferase
MHSLKCTLCGEIARPQFEALAAEETGNLFSVLTCPVCFLGHTIPQPEDLASYYTNYQGGPSTDFCTKRRLGFVRAALRNVPDGGTLLDVGCGDGHFLKAARKLGWKVAGTELNPEPARAAGLEVSSSLIDLKHLAPVDCITLWHSLEHLRNPLSSISELVTFLKPGGTVVAAVPNAQGWQARFFGPKWLHLDIPRHLFHFGPASLKRLLEGAGLIVKRTWHQEFEYDLFGWSISTINSIRKKKFGPLTSQRQKLTPRAAADLGLLMAFSCLAVPLVAAGSITGCGGTVVMAAQKELEMT